MKINTNNREKIEKALEEVQKKAKVRTIDVADLINEIKKIEKRLHSLNIKMKDWKGVKFCCSPHMTPFPGAYKGRPEGTEFIVERGSGAWFIVDISRAGVNGNEKYRIIFINEDKYREFYKF